MAPASGVVPEGVHLHRWRLGFRQCGFHRITRDLHGNAFDTFAAFRAFPPCCFPLPLSRSGGVGVPKVISSRALAPCGGDPAPSETAHPLGSYGSCHPDRQTRWTEATHFQCANIRGYLSVIPCQHTRDFFWLRSRLYFLRTQPIK